MSCGREDIGLFPELSLQGTTWKLETIELASGDIQAPEGQDLTLHFEREAQGELPAGAQADCNECGGLYSISRGNSIDIELSCTEMACTPASLGSRFSRALNSATTFDLEGRKLRLSFSNANERGVLVFLEETQHRSE
jgi:heat shock protein HslJ